MKNEIYYDQGKGGRTVANSESLLAYWGIFLYSALCEATDSPSQRRTFFKVPGELQWESSRHRVQGFGPLVQLAGIRPGIRTRDPQVLPN